MENETTDSADESHERAAPTNYNLYKCNECGKIVTGFMQEEHVRKAHRGARVEWRKL